MGCAGSRPHLIPSLSNHHHHHNHNSPQKGFILFNAKTIEYLKANEKEIKQKLKQRCELKLSKPIPQSLSSKSLLINAKRTLLLNNSTSLHNNISNGTNNADNNNGAGVSGVGGAGTGVKSNKSDASLVTTATTANQNDSKFRESAIESAVDYVLNYALNDFDIENFKSSNHLSMKQIRKDIMKKNNNGVSLSKLNNSVSMHSNTMSSMASANTTTTPTLNQSSREYSTLKSNDLAFYKLALNAAIDEFGSFIQENFIVINEFQSNKGQNVSVHIDKSNSVSISKLDNDKQEETVDSPVQKQVELNAKQEEEEQQQQQTRDQDESTDHLNDSLVQQQQQQQQQKINEDEEALQLKEALEIARQNFYKGKMSVVCLTKAGGYVVKEVKDQNNDNSINTDGLVVVSSFTNDTSTNSSSNLNKSKTESIAETTKQKIEEPITATATTTTTSSASPQSPTQKVQNEESVSPKSKEKKLKSSTSVYAVEPPTNNNNLKIMKSSSNYTIQNQQQLQQNSNTHPRLSNTTPQINIEDVDISATFKIIETNNPQKLTNKSTSKSKQTSNESLNNKSDPIKQKQTSNKSNEEKLNEQQLKQNEEIAVEVAATTLAARKLEIENILNKSFIKNETLNINELKSVRNEFISLLNDTIELIVNYSTKSGVINATATTTATAAAASSSSTNYNTNYNNSNNNDDNNKLSRENELKNLQYRSSSTTSFASCFDNNNGADDLLISNLEKSKRIIEILNSLNEIDYNQLDEKLVETTLNLDYVNREFKSYLRILEETQKKQLETMSETTTPTSSAAAAPDLDLRDKVAKTLDKIICIRKYANDIDKLNSSLPKKLFSCKGLPHPIEANQSLSSLTNGPSINTAHAAAAGAAISANLKSNDKLSSDPKLNDSTSADNKRTSNKSLNNNNEQVNASSKSKSKKEASTSHSKEKINSTGGGPQSKTIGSDAKGEEFTPKSVIDIRKEIAFSILNVGEVLAKTIDYYSLDPNDYQQSEELQELIKLSEQQATLQKQQELSLIDNGVNKLTTKPDLLSHSSSKQDFAVQHQVVVEEETTPVDESGSHQNNKISYENLNDQSIKPLHVQTETNNLIPKDKSQQSIKSDELNVQKPVVSGSSASSLSSPSIASSSSLSPACSISPGQQQQQQQLQKLEEEKSPRIDTKNLITSSQPVTPVPPPGMRHDYINGNVKIENDNNLQNEIDYLAGNNMNIQLNYLDESAERRYKSKESNSNSYEVIHNLIDGSHDDKAKSSSSSSDILTNSNEEIKIISQTIEENSNNNNNNNNNTANSSLTNAGGSGESQAIVQQFITNIIETASQRFTNELEQIQPVKFRNLNGASNGNNSSCNKMSDSFTINSAADMNGSSKRMSLDEELFYQLEEVDKKVKYMNETCSENEDDDADDDDEDLDDENFDYDESVELENTNDERLFHPRTPAKIKSEVRQNRAVDLHEEIKQISNVIQDLVQTINVRNNNTTSTTNSNGSDGIINGINNNNADNITTNDTNNSNSVNNSSLINNNNKNGIKLNNLMMSSSYDENISDNNNADSEDGSASQNSGSGTETKTKSSNGSNSNGNNHHHNNNNNHHHHHYSRNSNGNNSHNTSSNGSIVERRSIHARRSTNGSSANNSFSNIPVRQKVLTKQKATSIEDEKSSSNDLSSTLTNTNESFKSIQSPSTNFESFVDVSSSIEQQQPQQHQQQAPTTPDFNNSSSILNNSHNRSSANSQKFRSKLPVKK